MEYKRVDLNRVVLKSPNEEPYVFTYRPDLSGLQASIDRSGLLVSPVLKEDEAGTCRVICGSLRIRVIRRLGWESVHCFVVSGREWTDAECLSRSILENRWHRGFNEVEKALLFTRLKDRFPHLLADLNDALAGDLRMPKGARALEPYRFLLALPEPILDGLARGELSFGQALLLRGLPEETQTLFSRIMIECGLTLQEARKAADWMFEASRREGTHAAQWIAEEVIPRALNGTAGPRQKAQRLFAELHRRRYPLLESWKARFASARSGIGARDEGIEVSHDPTFETTQVRVQIRAGSAAEFRKRLETLSDAVSQGKIERLFQALSVTSDDPA